MPRQGFHQNNRKLFLNVFVWFISGIASGIVLLGAGCTSNSWTLDFSEPPVHESTPLRPTITYPDWVALQTGVEYKQQAVTVGAVEEIVHLVRIDQTQTHSAIAVNETNPLTVSDWATTLGASIVINGSYFDEQYHVVTRTKVAGESYGALLSGHTGVAQLTDAAGWTISPWTGETIIAATAIQSYPVLVQNGAAVFTEGSNSTAQRTVVATDREKNLYFIVCEYGVLSLAQLAQVLATELGLPGLTALNLDGGTSTGIVITTPTVSFSDDSLAVPSVLYILPDDAV